MFKEDWFYNAISYLSYHNVITGYGNGQVKPEGLCTRAQFVALLQRYAAELGGIAGSRAELSALIASVPRLFNRMRNRLEDAVELARKQVRWNFKTAIPCYFPTRNVMSLMLPLALQNDNRPDAALVVELTHSGNYQGQTILNLQQAYLDGRLLCRPNSEWLDSREIPGDEAELDED